MEVQKIMDLFKGKKAFMKVLTTHGHHYHTSAPSVWLHREALPDKVIISLMIENHDFNPLNYGWHVAQR